MRYAHHEHHAFDEFRSSPTLGMAMAVIAFVAFIVLATHLLRTL